MTHSATEGSEPRNAYPEACAVCAMTTAQGARFRLGSKDYYHQTCRACEAKRAREYAAAHRLQKQAYKRAWREKNRARRSPVSEGKGHAGMQAGKREKAPARPKAPTPTPAAAPAAPDSRVPTLKERLRAKRAEEQEQCYE